MCAPDVSVVGQSWSQWDFYNERKMSNIEKNLCLGQDLNLPPLHIFNPKLSECKSRIHNSKESNPASGDLVRFT